MEIMNLKASLRETVGNGPARALRREGKIPAILYGPKTDPLKLIIDKLEEAQQELEHMLKGKFGAASKKVVVEEFLSGIELSVFIITDGEGYVILPEAKDYKRIGEGDTGLNTGGMGCVSPVPFANNEFLKKVEE
mgnify:CR=1 FL=1